MTFGGRAGRILALSIAVVVAALGLLLLPSPVATSAAPTQDCSTTSGTSTITEPCAPELTTTTTTLEETTTSTTRATTSTTRATTTTARQTTTTAKAAAQATTTTRSTTTSANLLVPGDGTEGAELTTTTVLSATRISDGGPSDGTLIALVIVGLLLIAGVVGVLTWRYWVATRPPLVGRDNASARAG